MTPGDPPVKRNMQRLASMRPSGNFVLDGLRGAIASQGTPLPQMTPEERAQAKESLETAGTMVAGLTPLDTPVAAMQTLNDLRNKRWGSAVLDGAGLLPMVPMLGGLLVRGTTREAAEEAMKNLAALRRDGHVYRGMTEAEYKATLGSGHGVRSRQDYSVAGEGTSFADDPADAESYANFGRDDPRTTQRPNYLVEVKQTDRHVRDPRDGYIKAQQEIPRDDVTRLWEMRGAKGNVEATDIWQKLGSLFQP